MYMYIIASDICAFPPIVTPAMLEEYAFFACMHTYIVYMSTRLENRVSWVRVPPEAAFSLKKRLLSRVSLCCVVLCCFVCCFVSCSCIYIQDHKFCVKVETQLIYNVNV